MVSTDGNIEPDIRYSLAHGTGVDPHDGPMDHFGRITELLWHNDTTSTDLVHIRHGYDRASNRTYREDPIAASYSKNFDELYTYDGLNRLIDFQRGDPNPTKDAILPTTKTFAEDWSLDATGNKEGQATFLKNRIGLQRGHGQKSESIDRWGVQNKASNPPSTPRGRPCKNKIK